MGNKINNFSINIFFNAIEKKRSILYQNTDSMILMLDKNNKLISEKYIVFFNNKISNDASLELVNKRTDKDFRETINLNLDKIDKNIKKILFILNINKAQENKLDFSYIENLNIKILEKESKNIFAEYNPSINFNNCFFVSLISFVLDQEWNLEVVEEGYKEDFYDFLNKFFDDLNNNSNNLENNGTLFEEWCYKILECNKQSTMLEIKAKYKELIKSFHPDTIQALNLHKDIVEFAKQRFMDIKKAYDYIKKIK